MKNIIFIRNAQKNAMEEPILPHRRMSKILFGLCAFSLLVQSESRAQSNVVTLNTPVTATQTNAACKQVLLTPGFQCASASGVTWNAFVSPYQQCDVSYVNGFSSGGGSGSTPGPLNTSLAVGTTAGAFSVTESGSASYVIPLIAAPGTAGMVPNLSLSYNSDGGDGLMGFGWSLSGLSSITRTSETVYNDGKISPVALNNTDRFLLDGNRLIATNGTYGFAGTTYGTETETFSRITSYGAIAGGGGPQYFTVEGKDGRLYEYGVTADSRIEASGSLSNPVLTWLLDKVTDLDGNYMTLTYMEDNVNGIFHVDHIDYTGNTTASVATYNQVKFVYSNRIDKQISYTAGHQVQQNVVLTAVQMFALGTQMHEYDLNYANDGLYSHLTELVEMGSDFTQYNSTKFTWHNNLMQTENTTALTNMADIPFTYGSTNPANKYNGFTPRALLQGDFNGDGMMDVIMEAPTNAPMTLGVNWSLFTKTPGANSFTSQSTGSVGNGLITNYISGPIISSNDGRYIYPREGYTTAIPSLDINGDGKDDMALYLTTNLGSQGWSTADQFQVSLSTGTGFGQSYIFNGANTSSGFNTAQIFNTAVGDFDGDGIADLLVYYPISSQFYLFSVKNGVATTVKFTDPNAILEVNDQFNPMAVGTNYVSTEPSTAMAIDIDGDGRNEVMVVGPSKVYIFNINANNTISLISKGTFTNWGTSVGGTHVGSGILPNSSSVYPGDFNGDGKTDLLIYNNFGGQANNWYIGYSNGSNGFNFQSASNILTENGFAYGYPYVDNSTVPTTVASLHEYFVADFNGDGKSDIVDKSYTYAMAAGGGGILKPINYDNYSNGTNPTLGCYTVSNLNMDVYFSSGETFAHKNINTPLTGVGAAASIGPSNPTYVGDFNGDGHADLAYYGNSYEPDQLYSFDFNNQPDNGINKVVNVTNGLNLNKKIFYSNLCALSNALIPNTNNPRYIKGTTSVFPVMDIQSAMSVVEHIEEDNATGTANAIQYAYAGAMLHLQGKGFLGFSSMRTTDWAKNVIVVNSYDQPLAANFFQPTLNESRTTIMVNYPNGGLKYYMDVEDKGFTYQINSLGNTRQFTYLNKLVDTDILRSKTTTTLYTEDQYGNMLSQNSTNAAVALRYTVNTYEKQGSWIPSTLTSTIEVNDLVCNASAPWYVRTTNYTNNPDGKPNTVTTDGGNTVSNLWYNQFGTLTTTFITGGNIVTRGVSYTYDSKGRFPVKQINSIGQTVQNTYSDAYGGLITSKDANQLVTANLYDGFGRLKQTTSPTNQITTCIPSWVTGLGQPNTVYYNTVSGAGMPTQIEFKDQLGRTLQATKTGFDGRAIITSFNYNAIGQLTSSSEPYYAGDSPLYNTATYDNYFRPLTITTSNGAVTTYSFSSNPSLSQYSATTVTTSGSGTKTVKRTTDAGNYLVSTTDDGGTMNYTCDNSGQFSNITLPGTSIPLTITYDNLGRKTSMTDPDAGKTSYTYNALGEIISQTDANSSLHTLTRDGLGRVTSNTGTEGVITYTYDNKPNGLGVIGSVSTTGNLIGNVEYVYDAFSRLQSKTEKNVDGVNYTTSYLYNTLNQVVTETYPSANPSNSPFAITNTYNSYGYLQAINRATSGNTSLIWQCNGMTARESVTSATSGNGLVMTKNYTSYGLLQGIQVTDVTNTQLWNQAYVFDQTNGNLKNRTSNLPNPNSLQENFTYDNLDRLTKAQVNTNTALSTTFDNSGNVTSKSDVGTYVYNAPQPHAVGNINNPAVSGFPYLSQQITYNEFKRATKITEGTNEADLTYGFDHNRRKMVIKSTSSGLTPATKYYIGDYENTMNVMNVSGNSREVHYISGSDGLCAIYARSTVYGTVTDTVYYIHTDHLGSIALISLPNGHVAQEVSYDAWGRRRPANNWITPMYPAGIQYLFDRGYTGHEHLEALSLINMNARLYDPIIGRMLNPDNEVQTVCNSQAFNRYTYAENNPLKYTDPTGNEASEGDEEGPAPDLTLPTVTVTANHYEDLITKYDVPGADGGPVDKGPVVGITPDGQNVYAPGIDLSVQLPTVVIEAKKTEGISDEKIYSIGQWINNLTDFTISSTTGFVNVAQKMAYGAGNFAKIEAKGLFKRMPLISGGIAFIDGMTNPDGFKKSNYMDMAVSGGTVLLDVGLTVLLGSNPVGWIIGAALLTGDIICEAKYGESMSAHLCDHQGGGGGSW